MRSLGFHSIGNGIPDTAFVVCLSYLVFKLAVKSHKSHGVVGVSHASTLPESNVPNLTQKKRYSLSTDFIETTTLKMSYTSSIFFVSK